MCQPLHVAWSKSAEERIWVLGGIWEGSAHASVVCAFSSEYDMTRQSRVASESESRATATNFESWEGELNRFGRDKSLQSFWESN